MVLDKDVFDIGPSEDDEDDDDMISIEDPEFGHDLWQQIPLEESWEGYNRMLSFTKPVINLKTTNSNVCLNYSKNNF